MPTRLESFEESLDSAKRLVEIVASWFFIDDDSAWSAYQEKPHLTVLQGGLSILENVHHE